MSFGVEMSSMDLRIQSISTTSCHLKDPSLLAPSFHLPKALCKRIPAKRRGAGLRCRAHEDDPNAKAPSHYSSWLETHSLTDIYGGWSPVEENQQNGHSFRGWLKIGGAIFLGIGIALGSHLIYRQTGVFDKLIPVPIKEQVVFSNLDHSQATRDTVNNDSLSIEDEEGTEKQKLELPADSSSSNFEHKETAKVSLESNFGKILVPAAVDHMQQQTLAALRALKVIEAGAKPDAFCSRREYARWLIAASGTLTKCPAHKVLPAMYIENVTELAFDDVSPEDPDFPCIQGLAEAGLISSKLTKQDLFEESVNHALTEDIQEVFLPDSPLSRQDLVSWKLALERRQFPAVNKEEMQEKCGFIDIDKIHPETWPALVADVSTGERSIVALAFGYTRRFQPDKPVTKAQAAVALSTGEASDIVSEELARLEADSIAEAAVAALSALESKAQIEAITTLNHLLEEEKAKKDAADKSLECILSEMQRLKVEMDEENDAIVRKRAAVESERMFLSRLQQEVEAKSESLVNAKLEVAFERERIEKLHIDAAAERKILKNLEEELEVERKALIMARLWAEEEAQKAYSHAKALEAARKRWVDHGIQVYVDEELDDSNIPALSWKYGEDSKIHKSALSGLLVRSRQFRWKIMEAFAKIFHTIEMAAGLFKRKANNMGLLVKFREFGWKIMEAFVKILHIIKLASSKFKHKAEDLGLRQFGLKIMDASLKNLQAVETTVSRFKHEALQSLQKMKNTAAEVKDSTMLVVIKKAGNLRQILYFSTCTMSSSLREATNTVVGQWKGGIQVQGKDDLDGSNGRSLSWQYDKDVKNHGLQVNGLLTKFMWQIMDAFAKILHALDMVIGEFKRKMIQAIQELGNKAVEVKDSTTSEVAKKAGSLQQIIFSSTSNISSGLREGMRMVVDQCKEGAGMIAQKFKTA